MENGWFSERKTLEAVLKGMICLSAQMTAYIYSFIVPMTDSTNWRQMEIVSAFDYVITEMVNVVAVQQ